MILKYNFKNLIAPFKTKINLNKIKIYCSQSKEDSNLKLMSKLQTRCFKDFWDDCDNIWDKL